jgi:hypothetical protein
MVSEWTAPPGVAALTRLRAARAAGVRLMDELPLLPAPYVHLPHYVYRSAWTCSAEDHRHTRFYEPPALRLPLSSLDPQAGSPLYVAGLHPPSGSVPVHRASSAGIGAGLDVLFSGQLIEPVEQFAERVSGRDGLAVGLRDEGLPGAELTRSDDHAGCSRRNRVSRCSWSGSSGANPRTRRLSSARPLTGPSPR